MSLSDELHLSRPFTSVEEEALLSIFATYDLLNRGFAQALREHGLTTAQYNVMRILRGAGEEGLPLMTIARRMIVLYPNVTRLTDRLEADGQIRRIRCTEDRRVVRGFITEEGLQSLSQLDEEIRELNLHLMRGAQQPDLRKLISILDEVRGPLHEGDGKGPKDQDLNGNGRPLEL
jgi:DNA-binding MarR family transcriptional regulator